MESHWDNFWKSRSRAGDFYPQHGRIERVIRDINEEWKNVRALEVGCGTGGSLNFMLGLGMKPILLDMSQAALDKCLQYQHDLKCKIMFVRGNAFELPFKDGTVKLVFHQGLIEHFRGNQPALILKENLRVLEQRGWLVVDVPQFFHFEGIFSKPWIWTGKWFAGWQTYYTIFALKKLARSLDLKELRYFGAWMNPSFVYRAIRWMLKSWFLLPLNPPQILFVNRWRHVIRDKLFYHSIVLWTGASIGFAGRKPEGCGSPISYTCP